MREAARLRRAARMRRLSGWPAGHPSLGPVAGWAGRRRPVVARWLLVLSAPIAVAGVVAMALSLLALVVMGVLAVAFHALPMLVMGTVAFAAVRRRRHRAALRRGGAAGTAPLPGRPAAPPRPDVVWARARERFHALRAQYAAFECDTMEVLRIPALADVSVASTGRFVDAFAEAQALETDLLPPAGHGAAFVAAVDRAERAWTAARDAAERIRLSGLSPAERGTVERVIKLLTTARDSDSDPERLAAYARARSELAKLDRAGVIHLPRTAEAALDAAGRGALPA